MVGVIFGVDAVGHCIAMATICFAGALSFGLGFATAAFLLASVVSTISLFWRGGFGISIGIVQDTTVAILVPAIALANAAAIGPETTQIGTGLAVIGCSAVLSGLVFWLVGRFGLGQLVRMFPYPVAAGFLASSGYILVFSAFSIVLEPHDVGKQDLGETLLLLWPMLVMTGSFFLAMRFWSGATAVILVIGLFLAGFYSWLWVEGLDRADAVARHLLPALPEFGLGSGLAALGAIDWTAVALTAPILAAVVVLNLIGILLNTAGIELATGESVDVNHELRVAGRANLIIGLFGGLTSYVHGGATILADKLGVHPGAFAVSRVVVLLVAAAFAGPMVAAVPVFVAAALLMLIGVSMLWDWLVASCNQLVRTDWLIVLGIVTLTIAFGILPAIVAGLALAVLNFAVCNARQPVVRHITHAVARHSVLERSASARAALARDGGRICILHLQGALFFGSVEQLTLRLASLRKDAPGLQTVILDFSRVNTVDASACAAISRFGQQCRDAGVTLWLVGLVPNLEKVIIRWGRKLSATGQHGGLHHAATLDEALEVAEDALLSEAGLLAEERSIEDLMRVLTDDHPRTPELLRQMHQILLQNGDTLIRAQDSSRDVFFIESGRLGEFLPNGSLGQSRLRSAGPGAVIGEMAYLSGKMHCSDVVAEAPTSVFRLYEQAIDLMRREDTELAALLAFVLGRSVSNKLSQANALMSLSK